MNKLKIGLAVFLLAGMFAAGRYSVSKPAETKTSDTQTDDKTNKTKDTKTTTVTKIIEQPNGAKETDITSTTETVSKINKDDKSNTQTTDTVTPAKIGTLNVSVLAGVSTQTVNHPFTYGLSVTKQILGPVSIGGFGLNNGTLGASIGLSF